MEVAEHHWLIHDERGWFHVSAYDPNHLIRILNASYPVDFDPTLLADPDQAQRQGEWYFVRAVIVPDPTVVLQLTMALPLAPGARHVAEPDGYTAAIALETTGALGRIAAVRDVTVRAPDHHPRRLVGWWYAIRGGQGD